MKTFRLTILPPEHVFWEEETEPLTLATVNGERAIHMAGDPSNVSRRAKELEKA